MLLRQSLSKDYKVMLNFVVLTLISSGLELGWLTEQSLISARLPGNLPEQHWMSLKQHCVLHQKLMYRCGEWVRCWDMRKALWVIWPVSILRRRTWRMFFSAWWVDDHAPIHTTISEKVMWVIMTVLEKNLRTALLHHDCFHSPT